MPFDANQLGASGLYDCRAAAGSLRADLDQIQSLAVSWRHSRRKLGTWSTVGWIVGIIAFATGVLWFLGLILFGIASWALYRMKRYPKAVANHVDRCMFGRSMADMLAPDADPKEPVAMRLAFDPKEETLSENEMPNAMGRKNAKQKLSKASWFSVEANLHDGTTFTETIDDLVRRRSFTNVRGKSKVKVRTQSVIGMRVAYPSETYGDVTPLRPRMEKEIRVPDGTVLRALEVSPKAIKLKALSTKSGDPAHLAQACSMLALGVYRMLNLSREIETRKRELAKRGGPQ